MSYAPIIKEIGRGAKGARPQDAAQAESIFGDMLDGKVPELELGAIVIALRSVRVVAVTHPEYLTHMHEFLCANGGRAMLLRGTEGEAFANPRRRPPMQVFADGTARIAWPGEEGGAPPLAELPDCPAVAENALLIRAMLNGECPIPRPLQEQAQALARG